MKNIRPILQTRQQYESEQERWNSLDVRSDGIDDIIDKAVVKLKDEIWNYMSGVNLMKRGEKQMKWKETYVDYVAEEIFREFFSKEKKKIRRNA